MTEQEWLTSTNPAAMLQLMERSAVVTAPDLPNYVISDRKLRLFACACCRHYGYNLPPEAEDREDITEPRIIVQWARNWVGDNHNVDRPGEVWSWAERGYIKDVRADLFRHIIGNPFRLEVPDEPLDHSPDCCCGDMNCPGMYLRPKQFSQNVLAIATSLYEGNDCAFALHDALLEQGAVDLAEHFNKKFTCSSCNGEEIWTDPEKRQSHCKTCSRTGYEYEHHPKGCWALDFILEKE